MLPDMPDTVHGIKSLNLEEKLSYAEDKLALANLAMERATKLRENARELSGGLLSFGSAGPQRATQKVRQATSQGLQQWGEASEQIEYWGGKIRSYEARIAARDRVRFTRDDVVGARGIRTRYGWHRVARVNKTSVSVETEYSWVDRYEFDKILEVLR